MIGIISQYHQREHIDIRFQIDKMKRNYISFVEQEGLVQMEQYSSILKSDHTHFLKRGRNDKRKFWFSFFLASPVDCFFVVVVVSFFSLTLFENLWLVQNPRQAGEVTLHHQETEAAVEGKEERGKKIEGKGEKWRQKERWKKQRLNYSHPASSLFCKNWLMVVVVLPPWIDTIPVELLGMSDFLELVRHTSN